MSTLQELMANHSLGALFKAVELCKITQAIQKSIDAATTSCQESEALQSIFEHLDDGGEFRLSVFSQIAHFGVADSLRHRSFLSYIVSSEKLWLIPHNQLFASQTDLVAHIRQWADQPSILECAPMAVLKFLAIEPKGGRNILLMLAASRSGRAFLNEVFMRTNISHDFLLVATLRPDKYQRSMWTLLASCDVSLLRTFLDNISDALMVNRADKVGAMLVLPVTGMAGHMYEGDTVFRHLLLAGSEGAIKICEFLLLRVNVLSHEMDELARILSTACAPAYGKLLTDVMAERPGLGAAVMAHHPQSAKYILTLYPKENPYLWLHMNMFKGQKDGGASYFSMLLSHPETLVFMQDALENNREFFVDQKFEVMKVLEQQKNEEQDPLFFQLSERDDGQGFLRTFFNKDGILCEPMAERMLALLWKESKAGQSGLYLQAMPRIAGKEVETEIAQSLLVLLICKHPSILSAHLEKVAYCLAKVDGTMGTNALELLGSHHQGRIFFARLLQQYPSIFIHILTNDFSNFAYLASPKYDLLGYFKAIHEDGVKGYAQVLAQAFSKQILYGQYKGRSLLSVWCQKEEGLKVLDYLLETQGEFFETERAHFSIALFAIEERDRAGFSVFSLLTMTGHGRLVVSRLISKYHTIFERSLKEAMVALTSPFDQQDTRGYSAVMILASDDQGSRILYQFLVKYSQALENFHAIFLERLFTPVVIGGTQKTPFQLMLWHEAGAQVLFYLFFQHRQAVAGYLDIVEKLILEDKRFTFIDSLCTVFEDGWYAGHSLLLALLRYGGQEDGLFKRLMHKGYKGFSSSPKFITALCAVTRGIVNAGESAIALVLESDIMTEWLFNICLASKWGAIVKDRLSTSFDLHQDRETTTPLVLARKSGPEWSQWVESRSLSERLSMAVDSLGEYLEIGGTSY